jgi:hypothetical protein
MRELHEVDLIIVRVQLEPEFEVVTNPSNIIVEPQIEMVQEVPDQVLVVLLMRRDEG